MDYINTPLNYTGSKFKLLEQLLPEFDYSKQYFIDLFAGGGSVYTNVVDKYEKILVNDIIKDLIGIHQDLIFNSEKFINKVKELAPDKNNQEAYLKLREEYNKEKTSEKLYALMLSCTNNMMRFNKSGGFNQTFGKRSFSDATQKKIDIFIEHISQYKDKLIFTSNNFEKIKPTKSSMIYCDPPYGFSIKNDKITSEWITEAGYNTTWEQKDDINLFNYIIEISKNNSFVLSGVLNHNGKISWLLSKLIKFGFTYKEIKCDYNKVSRNGEKADTLEIIIKNF
jgi:DNA adenine methylase Dam